MIISLQKYKEEKILKSNWKQKGSSWNPSIDKIEDGFVFLKDENLGEKAILAVPVNLFFKQFDEEKKKKFLYTASCD